jgi:hypothetical protein
VQQQIQLPPICTSYQQQNPVQSNINQPDIKVVEPQRNPEPEPNLPPPVTQSVSTAVLFATPVITPSVSQSEQQALASAYKTQQSSNEVLLKVLVTDESDNESISIQEIDTPLQVKVEPGLRPTTDTSSSTTITTIDLSETDNALAKKNPETALLPKTVTTIDLSETDTPLAKEISETALLPTTVTSSTTISTIDLSETDNTDLPLATEKTETALLPTTVTTSTSTSTTITSSMTGSTATIPTLVASNHRPVVRTAEFLPDPSSVSPTVATAVTTTTVANSKPATTSVTSTESGAKETDTTSDEVVSIMIGQTSYLCTLLKLRLGTIFYKGTKENVLLEEPVSKYVCKMLPSKPVPCTIHLHATTSSARELIIGMDSLDTK